MEECQSIGEVGLVDRPDRRTVVRPIASNRRSGTHRSVDLAGLDLPTDTSIVFHDSDDPCGGHAGTVREDRGNEIWICVGDDDREHQERVVRHELAHIWTEDGLDPDAKARFLSLRGADNWNDRDVDWWDRGA